MSIPYFPLYVTDFEADTAHLTLAEDGAYNRLLRLIWRTTGCSVPDDPQWIMRRMRVSDDEYNDIIEPIIDEFLKRKSGRLFSPRLTEEFQKAKSRSVSAQNNGRKGGRPRKSLENNKIDKSDGLANQNPEKSYLEPEPEPYIDSSLRSESTPITPKVVDDQFDQFWKAYPRKKEKRAAKTKFKTIMKAKDAPTFDEVMAGLDRLNEHIISANTEPQFIKHPTTWLNQGCWSDEYTTAENRRQTNGATRKESYSERREREIRKTLDGLEDVIRQDRLNGFQGDSVPSDRDDVAPVQDDGEGAPTIEITARRIEG